jgi:hypothetical protein
MTDRSALSELANFVAASPLAAEDALTRRRALNGLAARLSPRQQRRSVGELLGAVLALSARTRRMVLPRVAIELDVYAPGGKRAVEVCFELRQ